MSNPNIVFIMTDQLRADCLGYAGHPDVKTPYLDTLAARGVVFDRAYSACPSCIAARAALHTGREQSHHGRVG
ncbi:MAG TPA: sulfatase-like hydrolase/transferase, partial [Candidatus Blautia merdipullorum]|nr:sulfatase-like hydrolase/transferase [Candidatus Blautia merdipullorum]